MIKSAVCFCFFFFHFSSIGISQFIIPVEIEYFNPTIQGNCENGSIDITINIGESPFDYELIDTQTDEDVDFEFVEIFGNQIPIVTTAINNLSSGEYKLIVTDFYCKFVEFDITLVCECPSLSYEITPITCDQTGSFYYTISEDENIDPDLVDFEWFGGGDNLEIFTPGDYAFQWSYLDCIIFEIIEVPGDQYIDEISVDYVKNLEDCEVCDGVLQVHTGDVNAPVYLYNEDGEELENQSGGIAEFEGLCAGNYTIKKFLDDQICVQSIKHTICCCDDSSCDSYQNYIPEFEIVNPTSGSSSDGSITVINNENHPQLFWFQWGQSNMLENLPVGEYSYQVLDGCGEFITGTIILEPCNELSISDLDYTIINDCGGNGIGSIEIFDEGLTFLWEDGSTGNSLTNLLANTDENPFYFVEIGNLNGCPPIQMRFKIENESYTYNVEVESNTPTCIGQATGSITLRNNGSQIVYIHIPFGETYTLAPDDSITIENLGIGLLGVFLSDGCNDLLVFELLIEEFEDFVEVQIEEIVEDGNGAHCITEVELSIPAGSHINIECGGESDSYFTDDAILINETVSINDCDFHYIIETSSGCIYEDMIAAPSFSIEQPNVISHCAGAIIRIIITVNNSVECPIESMWRNGEGVYTMTNVESGQTHNVNNIEGNELLWGANIFEPGEEWDLVITGCCGVNITERITIEELGFEPDDLTFKEVIQTGDSKYERSCVYTVCDVDAVIKPATKEMDWGNDNCCGQYLYYCPDVEGVAHTETITRITIPTIQADHLAPDGEACPNCPPDWMNDYTVGLSGEAGDLSGDNLHACDKISVCPNNLCCNRSPGSISGGLFGLFTTGGTNIGDCSITCGSVFWLFGTDYNVCPPEVCDVIPSGIDNGDESCLDGSAPGQLVQNCPEEEVIPPLACEIDEGYECEAKKMNFGWFHYYIDEIDGDYSDFHKSQLYEWYDVGEGWFYQGYDKRWCFDFYYCYCPEAEPEDMYQFGAWDPNSHPDDYEDVLDCVDGFDPDDPRFAVNDDLTCKWVVAECLKDGEDCDDVQIVEYDCYDFDDDPLGTGIIKVPFKQDEIQYIKCTASEFIRFLPIKSQVGNQYSSAIMHNDGNTYNYMFNGYQINQDSDFNVEYWRYLSDESELFYITRPVYNRGSKNEYVFTTQGDQTSWSQKTFLASEKLQINHFSDKEDSTIVLSGVVKGDFEFGDSNLGFSSEESNFILELNTFSLEVLNYTQHTGVEVKGFANGVYFIKSSEQLNHLANENEIANASVGDGVVVLNDRSTHILSNRGIGPLEILEIDYDGRTVDVLVKETLENEKSIVSILTIDKNNSTTNQTIATGDIGHVTFTRSIDAWYVGLNLNGTIEIMGENYNSRLGNEVIITKVNSNGKIDYANQYGGEGDLYLTQLEYNGYVLFAGGDVSINTGFIKFGNSLLSNPKKCIKGAYTVYLDDEEDQDDLQSLYRNNATLGKEDKIKSEFVSVYPNPTSEIITIEFDSSIEYLGSTIEIISSTNILLKNLKTVELREVIDISNLAAGIYFVKVTFTDGSVANKKVIKL